MEAFAEGSLNNVLGGSGPVNKGLDFDRIHGRGIDGFDDYNTMPITGQTRQPAPRLPTRAAPQLRAPAPQFRKPQDSMHIIDPTGRRVLHGEETAGLGTSTFLEGTPVPKSVLQRRESENDTAVPGGGGGLQRKKSLAQKLGMSRQRPDFDRSNGVTSPERRAVTPRSPGQTQSAGGRAKMHEMKPFFEEEGSEGLPVDADQAAFSTVQRARTASSPRRGMMRTMTNENIPPEAEGKTSGGLLSRVKSLKGGRRTRPERQQPSG